MARQQLRPDMYTTFGIAAPVATHWRPATCAETNCRQHREGWNTRVATGSDQERFLRQVCRGLVDGHRRPFTEVAEPEGTTLFVFEAGLMCFAVAEHRVRMERPELFIVRDGDSRWGANPRRYDRPDQWVDDHNTNLDSWRTALERG